MSCASASPDSNPTRAQLRLVVLGQWVRAGLDLTRGASAGRGLIGGAVALWRVFQAIRLAMQLAQRLSELSGVLPLPTRDAASVETCGKDSALLSGDPSPAAACLRDALVELMSTIRDALGLAPVRSGRPSADSTACVEATPGGPRVLGRQTRPRGRPPPTARRAAQWRKSPAPDARETRQPPIAAPAIGRFRLGEA